MAFDADLSPAEVVCSVQAVLSLIFVVVAVVVVLAYGAGRVAGLLHVLLGRWATQPNDVSERNTEVLEEGLEKRTSRHPRR